MLLIIAHHHDAEAQWLCKNLSENYSGPFCLLMPEALGVDYSITLQLRNDGSHHASIYFYGSETYLDGDDVSFAINRLSYINPVVWKQAEESEKAYATNEFNAFFPAFIHSLKCPLSNYIYNGALYGDNSFAAKWALYIHRYGISVNPLLADTTGKLYKMLDSIPAEQIYRFMYFHKQIILPLDQVAIINFGHLKEYILQQQESETLEFIFIKKQNGDTELIQVTKTPSLSCYGNLFVQALYQQINNIGHDHINGNTQRNTLAAAC